MCCDCNAPSPQWASPKFGVFICLSCAGVHRGLGVHISFVRSISMDAFKPSEIERMRLGGNEGWRRFFNEHADTRMRGINWDDATIAERYSGEVGDEWKERLTCKVEGRPYEPGAARPSVSRTGSSTTTTTTTTAPAARSTPRSGTPRTGTPLGRTISRGGSPTGRAATKARVDDKYFARLGADNASRPDDVPPSQGGKYAGFGNTPGPAADLASSSSPALPNLEEMQKDPVAALTRGFGWFTSTVTKTAKNVHQEYIQPTAKSVRHYRDFHFLFFLLLSPPPLMTTMMMMMMLLLLLLLLLTRSPTGSLQQLAEAEFAKQAQMTAAQLARQAQQAGKNAQEGFNKFVDGNSSGSGNAPLDESRKDFWDDFSSLADQRKQNSSSIGTSAMGMGKSRGGPGKARQMDEWDDW